jgi:hypothetical protein
MVNKVDGKGNGKSLSKVPLLFCISEVSSSNLNYPDQDILLVLIS